MTKEEIVVLIIENDLEEEVYNMLHTVIMKELQNSHQNLEKAHTDLRLIRKFADADNFDGVKLVLIEDGEKA